MIAQIENHQWPLSGPVSAAAAAAAGGAEHQTLIEFIGPPSDVKSSMSLFVQGHGVCLNDCVPSCSQVRRMAANSDDISGTSRSRRLEVNQLIVCFTGALRGKINCSRQ